MKKNVVIGIIVLLVILYFVNEQTGFLFAFEDPLNNKMTNPGVESWETSPFILPTGWTYEGWSSGSWPDLEQSTTQVREGTYSAGIIGKGYDGANGPCNDWCRWETELVSVVPQTILHARFYYYPVSFTRFDSGTDGFRTQVIFYDSNSTSMGGLSGPTLSEADFATQAWQEVVIEGVVPTGAVAAGLKFTIATRADNRFEATLYLDDMWIEGESCTEAWSCTEWSYCEGSYRTRTCTDANACGTFFNKPAESETCDTGIDEFIQQYKDGNINIVAIMEKISEYRGATQSTYDFVAMYEDVHSYGWHISEAYIGWEDATATSSMLTMYEATGDTTHLDRAITRIDYQISLWPFEGGNWGDGTDPARPSEDTASAGNLIENYVKFAYIVQRDGLTQYYIKAQEYYDFAELYFLQYWEQRFKSFIISDISMGCIYTGDPDAMWHCDRFNALAQVGTSFMYAWKYSDNLDYKDYAEKIGRFFKYLGLHVHDDCVGLKDHYEWGYRVSTGLPTDDLGSGWGQYEDGHREETHYAVYDFRMVHDMYEQGIVFDSIDVERFINTFLWNMWNGNAAEPLVMRDVSCWQDAPFSDMHYSYETGYTHGITRFNYLNPTLKLVTETIAIKLYEDDVATGNYWSEYYRCVDTADFGRVCYSDARAQPDFQMFSLANIIYADSR